VYKREAKLKQKVVVRSAILKELRECDSAEESLREQADNNEDRRARLRKQIRHECRVPEGAFLAWDTKTGELLEGRKDV